jgi:hypothetical protein
MDIVKFNEVNSKILTIRKQEVILDSDVAALYGVETKRVNEAVANNPDKFPEGYIIGLASDEWKNLKSKISASSWGGKNKLPNAFTEKGLYMLATILKSPRATQTTIAIVEAFAKIRELARTVSELSEASGELKQKSLMQKGGEIIADILGDDLKTTDTETSVELNFAVFKFKHTVKRKTDEAK